MYMLWPEGSVPPTSPSTRGRGSEGFPYEKAPPKGGGTGAGATGWVRPTRPPRILLLDRRGAAADGHPHPRRRASAAHPPAPTDKPRGVSGDEARSPRPEAREKPPLLGTSMRGRLTARSARPPGGSPKGGVSIFSKVRLSVEWGGTRRHHPH